MIVRLKKVYNIGIFNLSLILILILKSFVNTGQESNSSYLFWIKMTHFYLII